MDDLDPPLAERVLSHGHPSEPLDQTIARVRDKIIARGDLDYVSVAEQLSLLEQLVEFPFGQFLLQNRGWNGFWTDYVMQHPEHGRLTGTAPTAARSPALNGNCSILFRLFSQRKSGPATSQPPFRVT